jgi:hypothetical protein
MVVVLNTLHFSHVVSIADLFDFGRRDILLFDSDESTDLVIVSDTFNSPYNFVIIAKLSGDSTK